MKFSINQQDLQKSLSYCQGVIEKRSTLPILSNILLNVNNLVGDFNSLVRENFISKYLSSLSSKTNN